MISSRADPARFLQTGAVQATAMRRLLERRSMAIEGMSAILDFGCGCGRVARHWADLAGPDVYGCDYNEELIAWCRRHLPFMTAAVNQLAPPLPFTRRFDFIYAISVFTHLSEPLQLEWMEELRRALAPGGVLLFTTEGARELGRLTPTERRAFERGDLVVRFDESAGRNLCAAFHPRPFVERMVEGLEILESFEAGLDDVPVHAPLSRQDVHLVRKPTGG